MNREQKFYDPFENPDDECNTIPEHKIEFSFVETKNWQLEFQKSQKNIKDLFRKIDCDPPHLLQAKVDNKIRSINEIIETCAKLVECAGLPDDQYGGDSEIRFCHYLADKIRELKI